jgi:hypothetical protein
MCHALLVLRILLLQFLGTYGVLCRELLVGTYLPTVYL